MPASVAVGGRLVSAGVVRTLLVLVHVVLVLVHVVLVGGVTPVHRVLQCLRVAVQVRAGVTAHVGTVTGRRTLG